MEELVRTWKDAERVVVLTGAGMSTASGIADFRSPGGRWARYQPTLIQEFMASEAARAEYWRYKGETWEQICAAEPNPGHIALTDLANAGRIRLLVTQNVDGLHERSGFPRDRLVCIHGTDAEVICMTCRERNPREAAQKEWEGGTAAPRCHCGGNLKPATISFGQSLVEEDLARSFREAESCDLMVAAGTSLVVGPINNMVPLADRGGARTAILTASETPFDSIADFRINEPVEVSLARLCDGVLA
jgi:NAD-dependent deacetylase